MAIDITVEQVRALCPDLQVTDAAIELMITVVGCKVDDCLESNYADCTELAGAIKIYTVAYFVDKGNNNKGAITSQKWADGDSQSYSAPAQGTSAYWDTALQLDSSGCIQNAYPSGKVFAVTGRASTYYGCAQ